ncbi:MAG: hypothetical protein QGH42_09580 [Kiritimatiellia bacterium]|jgi:hypothetical protein|nr:hypothetical protein [Kiritimatiellia bacterium]MDP6810554.1 hypothetical protein [Kiritimatiellia bacterium]MDP7024472.1 hypothetical protein [Kiritimatiellia bacterium]
MIAPIKTPITLDDAVLAFARSATATFTAEDAFPSILGKLTDPPSEPWLAIDSALDDCDWLLLDDEHERYTPKHIFFAGTQFLIVPQPAEIEEGILVPGHRFLPFLARTIHPAECRLALPDGSVVPTRTFRQPMGELLLYLAFFGISGAIEYISADTNCDSSAPKTTAWRTCLRVWLIGRKPVPCQRDAATRWRPSSAKPA